MFDVQHLRLQADRGNVVAQTVLGICYLDGLDVEPNHREALKLLNAAADKGAPRAQLNLARMFEHGLGVQVDWARAIELYEAAAVGGEFFAQVALGRIYERAGQRETALRWYSAAAKQEHSINACDELNEAKVFVANN
jgi:TPR repeat protein